MLLLLLAIAESGLAVRSETSCPTREDVLRELGPHVEVPGAGWVRIANLTGQVYLVLHAEDGHEVAAERVEGATCAELATASARSIARWDQLPTFTVEAPQPEPRDLGRTLRLLGSVIGAAMGTLVPVGVSLVVPHASRKLALLTLEVLLGAPLTGLTAWLGHRLAGGLGNYGAAVGGAAIGVAAAVLPFVVTRSTEALEPAPLVVAAVLSMGTPALFLELSDARERNALSAAVIPMNGGAAVAFGGRL